MFDNFAMKEGRLVNVECNGEVIGFSFDIRITDYRGCFLSLVHGFYVEVDGVEYPRELQKLSVNGKPLRDYDEIKKCVFEHWDFDDYGTVFVSKPGGLEKGHHKVGVKQGILTQYGWQPHDQEWIDNTPDPIEITGKQSEVYYYDMEVK